MTLERTRNHILVGFSVSTTIPYWRLAKLIAATESFGARHDLRGALAKLIAATESFDASHDLKDIATVGNGFPSGVIVVGCCPPR